MHFIGLVTVSTIHARLGRVDIPLATLSIVLVTHPAAVTGGALVEGIWTTLKHVSPDKSLLGEFRPAHVAAAAAGVAGGTMVLARLVDMLPFFHVRTAPEHFREGGKGGVQGIFGRSHDFVMTIATGIPGVVDGRMGVQSFMGHGFSLARRVPAMAVFTRYFAVAGGKKFFGNQDFLLRFQRNHLPASAGTCLHGRGLDHSLA